MFFRSVSCSCHKLYIAYCVSYVTSFLGNHVSSAHGAKPVSTAAVATGTTTKSQPKATNAATAGTARGNLEAESKSNYTYSHIAVKSLQTLSLSDGNIVAVAIQSDGSLTVSMFSAENTGGRVSLSSNHDAKYV